MGDRPRRSKHGSAGRAGAVGQRPAEQPRRARGSLRQPGRAGVLARRGGVVPEQLASQPQAGHPVGHRMVDAPDDHRRAVLGRSDKVHVPKRLSVVEALGHQLGDDVGQLLAGGLADADLVGDLELGVVDPDRRRQPERRPGDPPPCPRCPPEPALDVAAQLLDVGWSLGPRLEHQDLAGVTGDRRGLELQDRGVVGAEAVEIGHRGKHYGPGGTRTGEGGFTPLDIALSDLSSQDLSLRKCRQSLPSSSHGVVVRG